MFRFAQKEHLIVPAHIDHLPSLRDFVTQIGSKYGYSKKLVRAFKIAIDEAAANIIKHAYDGEGYITIQAIIRRKSLTINMIDQGAFFDPKWAKAPDIRDTAAQGEKVGLGIFMMRKLMDEIGYQKTQAGNELSLTKHDKYRKKPFSLGYLWSLPPALRVRYFVNAIILVTLANAGAFSYLYFEADHKVTATIIESGRKTAKRIGNRLSFDPGKIQGPNAESEINSIILPEYRENIQELHSVSLEDTLGRVAWSTVSADTDSLFVRPDIVSPLASGALEYHLRGSIRVLEIERALNFKQAKLLYSKVHVFLSGAHIDNEIDLKRLHYLKLAAAALGASYILLALLSYIVTRPVRKLAEWIKATRQGEIRKDLDIDGSSELGEIAQAFTEITERFNETQKHLEHRERFEKEIHLAKDIQGSLLPSAIPVLEKIELAAFYQAAVEVGGDYYDFIDVDKDHLGIIIADVSGKGVPGSMVMTMIRTALKTEARGILDAAEVLTRVHEFVAADMKYGMFVTMFYMILDKHACTINFASAGHTPLLLHRACTGKTFYLNPIGCPVGITLAQADFFKNNIESETVQLDADDTLLLYTDGVTEARNPKQGSYGEGRLLNQVRKNHALKLDAFLEKIKNSIYSFGEDSAHHDDITMVAIRRKAATDEEADQPIVLDEDFSVETKFLSIEDTTKILDVAARHPDFDSGKISKELNRPRYKNAEIPAGKIESELIRQKLNTVDLRNRYATLCEENRRNTNPPGMPRLTLSGNVRLHKTPKVKSVTAGLLKAPEDSPPHQKTQAPQLPQTPQEILDMAPPTESDFVFGAFIDDLLRSTSAFEKLENSDDDATLEQKQPLALQAPDEEDTPERKAFDESDSEDDFSDSLFSDDISDALVDAILGNLDGLEKAAPDIAETDAELGAKTKPVKPEVERSKTPSDEFEIDEAEIPEARPVSATAVDLPEPDTEVAAEAEPVEPEEERPGQEVADTDLQPEATETDHDESKVEIPSDEPEVAKAEIPETRPVLETSPDLPEPDSEATAQAEPDELEEERPEHEDQPEVADTELQSEAAETEDDEGKVEIPSDEPEAAEAEIPETRPVLETPPDLPEHESEATAQAEPAELQPEAADTGLQGEIAETDDDGSKLDPSTDETERVLGLPPNLLKSPFPLLPPGPKHDEDEFTEDARQTETANALGDIDTETLPLQSVEFREFPESDLELTVDEQEFVAEIEDAAPPEDHAADDEVDDQLPEPFSVASIQSNTMDETQNLPRRPSLKREHELEADEATNPIIDSAVDALLGQHQPQTSFGEEVEADATSQDVDPPELQETDSSVHPDFEESTTGEDEDAGALLDQEIGIALSNKDIRDIPQEDEVEVEDKAQDEGEVTVTVEGAADDKFETDIVKSEPETDVETSTQDAPTAPEIPAGEKPEFPREETLAPGGAEPEPKAEQPYEIEVEPIFTLTCNVVEDKFLPRPIRKRRRSRRRLTAASEESSQITLSEKQGRVMADMPEIEQSHRTQPISPDSQETQTDQDLKTAQTPAEMLSQHVEPEPERPEMAEEQMPSASPVALDIETTTQVSAQPDVAETKETVPPEPPIEPPPQQPRTHREELLRGIERYKAKEYEDAIIAFKAALRLAPDSMEAYAMLGNAFFRNNMFEEALTAYEQIEQEAANELAIHENIGLIYWKLGQHEAATRAWRDALRKHPERQELARRLEFAKTHQLAQQSSMTISKEANAQEMSDTQNSEPATIQNGRRETLKLVQAGIEQYRNNDFESAIITFRSAINHFPNKQEAYSFLGNAYFRNQMYTEAAEIYERLLDLNDDSPSVLENLAFIHFKQGDYQSAVEKWKQVLAKEPERRDLEDRIEKLTQLF